LVPSRNATLREFSLWLSTVTWSYASRIAASRWTTMGPVDRWALMVFARRL
jgi:hypothetical protein